jgi:hypothetical protein
MNRTFIRLGLLAALLPACATTTQATETTPSAQPTRARPRRRAAQRALTQAAERAAPCLPPSVPSVDVVGAFVGETGEYRVESVTSAVSLSPEVRMCVREVFEAAHVPPFREARFAATQTVTRGAAPGEATPVTAPSVTAATPPATATAPSTTTAAAPEGATTEPGVVTGTTQSPVPHPMLTSLGGQGGAAGGTLDMSQVANIVRGRTGEIRTCYQGQLARDPQLAMRLRVRFTIEQAGTVSGASSTTVVSAGDDVAAGEVARCVETVVRNTTFPARETGGAVEATLPFVFTPSPGTATASAPTGRVDPVLVSGIIRNRMAEMRGCYTRALAADPTLAGRVTVRFVVTPTGRVTNLSSQTTPRGGGTDRLTGVARCVEGVLQPLTLPPPTGGPAAVALPLDFGPTS